MWRRAYFYTLKILDRDKIGAMCPSIEGDKEVILDRVKAPERRLAIARVSYVSEIEVLRGYFFRVYELKHRFDVH